VPQTVKLTCVEAFSDKDLLSDGYPIAVRLTPFEKPREALPTKVVIELTDSVRFLHSGGDNYAVTCPDQT
jgi:hypothetical protein